MATQSGLANVPFDPTSLVNALQAIVQILGVMQQTLAGVSVPLKAYTVASLPTSLPLFSTAWATNGRANSGEGSGAGTGTAVVWNGTAWIALWSGTTVLS
jgi:hypothetical protein